MSVTLSLIDLLSSWQYDQELMEMNTPGATVQRFEKGRCIGVLLCANGEGVCARQSAQDFSVDFECDHIGIGNHFLY